MQATTCCKVIDVVVLTQQLALAGIIGRIQLNVSFLSLNETRESTVVYQLVVFTCIRECIA
jgi:hypothetical protein